MTNANIDKVLPRKEKTSAWKCFKITTSRAKKWTCQCLNQRKYQSRNFPTGKNSFPESKKPLELWALAAPKLGKLWTGEGWEMAIKGRCFGCRSHRAHFSPLGFSGGSWGRSRAGSSAQLGVWRVAVPQPGDRECLCRASRGTHRVWVGLAGAGASRRIPERPEQPLVPLLFLGQGSVLWGPCPCLPIPANSWAGFLLKSSQCMEANQRHDEHST